jgi:ketosteroid isomerase-like protein
MRLIMLALVALSWASVAGCAGHLPITGGASPDALMQADRDFARATAERGLDGWMSFYADDAVRIPQSLNGPPVQGLEAVRKFDARLFADPAVSLVWEPTDAGLYRGGALGFTRGRSETRRRDPGGATTVVGRGRYLTIWRREPSGQWKVILDTGVPAP